LKRVLPDKIKHTADGAANWLKYDALSGGFKKALIFLLIFALTAIVVSVPTYLVYKKVQNLVEEELGKNAKNIAAATAVMIERDVDQFRELVNVDVYRPGNYDEAYYREMLSAFRKIRQETNVSFVFAEKKISHSEIMYLFDGEDPESEDFSPIGAIDGMQQVESNVYKTGKLSQTKLVEDPAWGYYITGFAAVNDPVDGKILGVVGVDYSLNYIMGVYKGIRLVLQIGVFSIVLLLSILISRFFGHVFENQHIDYITGLHNRHYHEVYLRRLIRRGKITGKPFSLIMMDLDDFKLVNDKHGHLTGDAVLKSIARILKNQTRDSDVCSRYGGDEFVILLPDAEEKQAAHIAERIREVISNIALLDEAKNNLFSTVSVGVAQWSKGMNGEILTDNADKAMYASKAKGRNRVTIYDAQEDGLGTSHVKSYG